MEALVPARRQILGKKVPSSGSVESRFKSLCQADDRFQVGSRKNLAPYSERDYDCSQPGAEQIRFFRRAIPVWHLSDSPDTWQGLPG